MISRCVIYLFPRVVVSNWFNTKLEEMQYSKPADTEKN